MTENQSLELEELLEDWAHGAGPEPEGEKHIEQELLDLYVLEQLEKAEEENITSHLKCCARCLRQLGRLNGFLGAVESVSMDEVEAATDALDLKRDHPNDLHAGEPRHGLNHTEAKLSVSEDPVTFLEHESKVLRRMLPLPLRVALPLAASVLILVGLLWLQSQGRTPDQPESSYEACLAKVKGRIPAIFEDPLAANAFEDFVFPNGQTRSVGNDGIKILAPRGGIVETRPEVRLGLGGQSSGRVKKLRVTILSNVEIELVMEEIVEIPLGDSEFALPFSEVEPLPAGHYVVWVKSVDSPVEWRVHAYFHVIEKETVAKLRNGVVQSDNHLLDRHLLVAKLLLGEEGSDKEPNLAKLALKELGESIPGEASVAAHAMHLLLRARALEIMGKKEEADQALHKWKQLRASKISLEEE